MSDVIVNSPFNPRSSSFKLLLISATKRFIQKYFLEGQKLEEKQKAALETLPSDAPFMTRILVKHRRLIGERNTADPW